MTTRIELPLQTIAVVLGVVVGLWLLGRLWTQLLLLVVAALAAAVLDPIVSWLQQRGWSRGWAVGLLLVALIVVAALLLSLLLNPLLDQATGIVENLPAYLADIQGWFSGNPTLLAWLRSEVDRLSAQPNALLSRLVTVGSGFIGAGASLLIFITAVAYLLLEGRTAFAWLTGKLPSRHRSRAERIGREIGRVAGHYVGGQLVVSSLFGLFAFVTLSLAGAPAPLVLAFFAAALDAVPMVGATIATIPAVLFALTVSLPTGLIVLALFVIYQQVENNLIVPRVFGAALQISPLAVLVAILIGGALLGVFGALLALPTAAAIPAIARVWNDDDAAAGEGAGAPQRAAERQ